MTAQPMDLPFSRNIPDRNRSVGIAKGQKTAIGADFHAADSPGLRGNLLFQVEIELGSPHLKAEEEQDNS